MADSVRIDKYVWAIRLYKTRSDATEACNGNKVQLNGAPAKPSKAVKIGDTISVRNGVALYTFKVLQNADQRMGAQKVPEFAENGTAQLVFNPGDRIFIEALHAPEAREHLLLVTLRRPVRG